MGKVRMREAKKTLIIKGVVRRWRLWLGTALSLTFLALTLRNVRLPEVMEAIVEANYPLLALALGTVIVTTLAKAARWGVLFHPYHRQPRFSKLFSVLLIGQMANAVLPARLGELIRAYMLGEIERLSKAYALTTIVVEKTLDGLMLTLILAILLPFIPLPSWLRQSGIFIGSAFITLFILMFLVAYRKDSVLCLVDGLLRLVPGLKRLDLPSRLGPIVEGLATLRSRESTLRLWGWSIFIWIMAALTNYLTFLAMGIAVPFLATPFLLVVLHLGRIVPSSPGQVGVFHYLCILALSLFSVERSLALSYSLVLHLIVFLPMIALGAFYLWKENYDLQRLVIAVEAEGTRS